MLRWHDAGGHRNCAAAAGAEGLRSYRGRRTGPTTRMCPHSWVEPQPLMVPGSWGGHAKVRLFAPMGAMQVEAKGHTSPFLFFGGVSPSGCPQKRL